LYAFSSRTLRAEVERTRAEIDGLMSALSACLTGARNGVSLLKEKKPQMNADEK
jgi:hypothetical protein